MAACFCCFRCCWASAGGFNHVPLKELPTVQLDTSHMGTDVVIVKSCRRICGTGAALANAPIVQNKAYFEIKVQSTGIWGVGLATRKSNLNSVPLGMDKDSWVLRSDGTVFHDGEMIHKLTNYVEEGDVIGVTYDHIEMNFFRNGTQLPCTVTGIRGTVFPVFYVDESAILDTQFSQFYHTAPEGFEGIMFEQSLL
ncbi:SPRY domain-containing protein 7-like [Branchiostoma floridae x Branchiostoma japonicum]